MAIKDILVHVDRTKAASKRVAAALRVAEDHDARLTGLYIIEPLRIPVYAEVPIGREVLEQANEALMAYAEEAKADFSKWTKGSAVTTDWRSDEGPYAEVLRSHSRYADLVVVGQHSPDDADDHTEGLIDRLVLESGRPLLVVPYIGAGPTVGNYVTVAWNARREAVRAVNDALPMLERADQVDVLSVNPRVGPEDHGEIPSADICLHLARHGVSATAQSVVANDIDVANLLMSRCADTGSDMIVMGAYGHSRLLESVLGGTTHDVLRSMTVPVLMSH